jgi:hypothetical protein
MLQKQDRTASANREGTRPAWWIGAALSTTIAAILLLIVAGATADAATGVNATVATLPQVGSVTAGGADLIGIADDGDSGPFGPYVGFEVSGQAEIVESVVSDTSFWVGADKGHRLFVIVSPSAAPVEVAAGDLVSFDGALAELEPGFHDSMEIPSSIDLELLSQHMHYIDATSVIVEEPTG